jgi:hypothetical protein
MSLKRRLSLLPAGSCNPRLERILEIALVAGALYWGGVALTAVTSGNLAAYEAALAANVATATGQSGSVSAVDRKANNEEDMWAVVSTSSAGAFVIEASFNKFAEPQVLRLLRGGRVEYSGFEEIDRPIPFSRIYSLESNSDGAIVSAEALARLGVRDVTGDGVPELSFSFYTGGLHCCWSYVVLSLGKEVRRLTDPNLSEAVPYFEDLDDDKIPEIVTSDAAFAYWHVPGMANPMPRVIRKYDRTTGRYEIAARLMRELPLNDHGESTTTGWTSESWQGTGGRPFSRDGYATWKFPWSYVIDLIYTGRTADAVRYIDAIWVPNSEFSSKEDFWKEFRSVLESSDQYKDLVVSGLLNPSLLP